MIQILLIKLFFLLTFFFNLGCEENVEPEDCAGIAGGSSICGCMDSTASNYDSLATTDDGSCEYLLNGVSIKWLKTYEVSSNSGSDESWCVSQVSDGGLIIAGASNYDGLLIKVNPNGDKEWHQLYDNSTSLYSVRQTADGGFIATGYYECDTLPGCYPDIYLLKTDGSGIIEWEISDGTSNNDWARDVVQTQDGNFVITGTWNDDGWNSKAMLRKYSGSGELIWAQTYSSSTANEGNSLLETSDGGLILVGYSGEQHGAYKHFMVKADAGGVQLWKKKTQSVGDALFYSVCESATGGYLAAGTCNSWRSNLLVERDGSGGAIEWENCHIDSVSHYGYYDITPASDGGYYLIDDMSYLTKIDVSGNTIFSVKLSHVNQSVIELEDGDIVVGGFGFREGNDGGPISLLRLDPSNIITSQ